MKKVNNLIVFFLVFFCFTYFAHSQIVVSNYSLYNADTDQTVEDFTPMPKPSFIDVDLLGTIYFNIRANITGGVPASVSFNIYDNSTDELIVSRSESSAPWFLATNEGNDDDIKPWYYPGAGTYKIVTTPAGGVPDTLIVTITGTISPTVKSFSLYSTDTQSPIPGYDPIVSHSIIDIDSLGINNISIVVNLAGKSPVAVELYINDMENAAILHLEAPFSLSNKTQENTILPWNYGTLTDVTKFVIKAVPAENITPLVFGKSDSLEFFIKPSGSFINITHFNSIAKSRLQTFGSDIWFYAKESSPVELKIYKEDGRLVKSFLKYQPKKGINSLSLKGNNLSNGIYFIRFIQNSTNLTKSFVLLN